MYEYTIEGVVTNGEGLRLAIYTSDQGIDERITTKIEKGKFTFKGTTAYIKAAKIRFENTINKQTGFMTLPVYTEAGTTTLKFEVAGEPSLYHFTKFEVIKGPENRFVRSFIRDYKKAIGDKPVWVTRDPDQAKDLQSNVYPAIRSRILKVYDQYFEKDISEIHLYLLKHLTSQFRTAGFFEKNLLSKEEMDKVKTYFQKLDPALSKNIDYRIVKTTIDRIHIHRPEKDFADYELESIKGEKKHLSEWIKNNRFTILSFWNAGCARCRVFHKEMNTEYEALKENGIELICINVDESQVLWRKASTEDQIPWPDLYAGRASTILARYHVRGFPAKLVYDQNMKFIDISFKNKHELWDWVKSETGR